MQSIADKMKDDLKYIGTIKSKLIYSNIWSDQTLSDLLYKTDGVCSIEVAHDKNRLFISTKKGYEGKLKDSFQQLLDINRSMIENLLDSKELEVLESLGTKKISNIMCHMSHIPANNTVIVSI